MKNVEPGPLGLGRTDPFFEIAKKNADYAAGVVLWYDPGRNDVPSRGRTYGSRLALALTLKRLAFVCLRS
jgi:hypothetical protein